MDFNLDEYFHGLDTVSVKAGGIEFQALYDELFYDEAMGGSSFCDNAPAITTQARFVKGLEWSEVVEVELPDGWTVFKALGMPRDDGTGLVVVPLSRVSNHG